MELEKPRRRRKFPLISSSSSSTPSRVSWTLLFSSFFFAFFFLLRSRPLFTVSRLFPLPTTTNIAASSSAAAHSESSFQLRVHHRVVFPDHVLLLFTSGGSSDSQLPNGGLDCIYHHQQKQQIGEQLMVLPVLSMDSYDGSRLIARCPLPPANYSSVVDLQKHGSLKQDGDDGFLLIGNGLVSSWESVVYAATLDGDTAVAFVKGLNLRPARASDPEQFSCHFNWGSSDELNDKFTVTTKAITAAQEVIRCSLPFNLQKNPEKANGVRVSIGVTTHTDNHHHHRGYSVIPSVAKLLHSSSQVEREEKYELCVCTMVWNQASAIREWIAYHAWLGVERWFIYDNNSDDEIKEVIDELERENYNVSRHVWPWIKTQEAGFSHCALEAKKQCKWVSFMDVDEFFYFPVPSDRHRRPTELGYPGRDSLRSLVANFSASTTIGEIRTACHSFGPSGLSKPPSQGVTVGYTCRLQSPERHKSIIRPDVLDESLVNVVHHFHLKPGYRYLNLPLSTAMINHYKYQVWESFRAKFYRRVATYVADWQDNQNEGSKDRAPGLGTEAIEPPNWRLQFCDVWDTGLRDFVMANLVDPVSGVLPWERPIQKQTF